MPGIDLSLMDRSVAPCDDFFRFANGAWLDRTEIPAEEPAYGGFTEVRDRNHEILRRVAEEAAAANAPAGSVERKVGDWWASGMDEAAIEAAGTRPLDPELALIAGLEGRAQLPALLGALLRGRAGPGFHVLVRQDPGDSTRNLLWLQQGGLGLPDRDYYLRDDARFDFHQRELQGVQRPRPRWKRILESMDQTIGEELGQLYVRRAFSPEAKRRVLELVEDLRAALRERIGSLEWMGDVTKAEALRKLGAFAVKIAYPDAWRDHSALEPVRGEHLRNVMRAREWRHERDLAKLARPVDRTEWLMSPQTVNAYYDPLMNEIVFPAGILQSPFFDPEADDAVNYGAIGMVIGHEMSHGFDDAGSRFDADGNLKEWWTADDRASYGSRQDLVVRQYEGYEPLAGQRINGKLTLGENIGDIGGIKIAWAAFQRRLARAGRLAPLDGFTPEQRFFLGMAQSWRSKIRDEALRVRLNVDQHSPPVFRVLAPLANMPEFHEAFGCGAGTRMWRVEEARPTIW